MQRFALVVLTLVGMAPSLVGAQARQPAPAAAKPVPAPAIAATPSSTDPTPPADYVVGVDDILEIVFWRDKEMSAQVVVRPDGKISLPLLNDVVAAGFTPEQLRGKLSDAASKFLEDPNVTVVVKAINSRRVFITGSVEKPGPYPLTSPTTVLQLIATAGGLLEYADSESVQVMRTEGGKTTNFKFNYKDVVKGKKLEQNLVLKPGDTVIVP